MKVIRKFCLLEISTHIIIKIKKNYLCPSKNIFLLHLIGFFCLLQNCILEYGPGKCFTIFFFCVYVTSLFWSKNYCFLLMGKFTRSSLYWCILFTIKIISPSKLFNYIYMSAILFLSIFIIK